MLAGVRPRPSPHLLSVLLVRRPKVVRSGSWVKVVVPDQLTRLDRRDYPGWAPTAQLRARPPVVTGLVATVVTRATHLSADDSSATPLTEISFGTWLPRVGVTGAGAGGDADRPDTPSLRQCCGGPDTRGLLRCG